MRTPTLTLAALLLTTTASASAIEVASKHCGCTLTEMPAEPHVNAPDPGYNPALSLGEIAALRAIDDAHEPMPEPSMWVWICLPGMPKVPTMPGKPDTRIGGDGGGPGGGGGQLGGEIDPRGGDVPEPSLLSLGLLGGMAWGMKRRFAPRRGVR